MSASGGSSGPESIAGSEVPGSEVSGSEKSEEPAPQFQLVDDVPPKEDREDEVPDVDIIHVLGVDALRRFKLDVIIGESVTSRKRGFTFQADMSGLLLGDLIHDAIESQALQLLSDLASSNADKENKGIPALIFVAYDFGALIVKKAIAIAAAREAQWSNVFYRTVQLVFARCFQRRQNHQEFDMKIWQFLQLNKQQGSSWTSLVAPFQTRDLAEAAVETTEAFLNSRITLRTPVISVFDSEVPGQGSPIFDFFTTALGVSTERVVQEPDGKDRPIPSLDRLVCYRSQNWVYDPQWTGLQQMLLSLAMPQHRQIYGNPQVSRPVMNSKQCRDWVYTAKSPILYIQGENEDHSRSLAEQLTIDWQSQLIRKQDYTTPALSFSFSSHDPARSTINSMICSAAVQTRAAISRFTDPKWNILLDLHRIQRGWTSQDLHNIFLVLASWDLEQDGLLVLHDLDECEPASRKAFLDLLQDEIAVCDSYIKVVVTSRRRLSLLGDSEKSGLWNVYDSSEDSSTGSSLPPSSNDEWQNDTVLELCPGGHGEARVREALQALESMDRTILKQILRLIQDHTKWPENPSARAWSGFITLLGQITPATSPAAMLNTILRSISDQARLKWILQWLIYSHRPFSGAELARLLRHRRQDGDWQFSPSPTADDIDQSLQLLKKWLPALVEFGSGQVCVRNTIWDILDDDNPDYIWNEITPAAHQTMLDFILAHLSSPANRDRLEELYDKYSQGDNADEDHLVPPVLPDGEDLIFYSVTAFPYHLERSPQPQKELEKISESYGYLLMRWEKVYWAMSNPFSRPSIETIDSPFSVLLGNHDLDPAFRKALKRATAAGTGSSTTPSNSNRSAAMSALICAASAGEEDNALKHIRRVLSDRPQNEEKFEDDTKDKEDSLSRLIWRATWLGMDRLLKALLAAKGSPDPEDVKSARYPSPLFMACIFGHTEVVKVLLKAGANPRVLRGSTGVLLVAAGNGYSDIVEALVSHDKGLLEMEQPNTPLYEACMWGSWKAAKTLLDLGAKSDLNTDYNGWIPLTVSADSGYTRTVRTLLENGADPDSSGPEQEDTALWPAIMSGENIECIRALLEHGANPNHERLSPPIIVEICSSKDLSTEYKLAVLDLLAANTPALDIDKVDPHGSSGLMWACSTISGNEAVVDWLLAHNADATLINEQQRGAIHYSAVNGYESIIKKLLERKPNLNTLTDAGESLLQISVDHGPEQVRLFLDADADPELENSEGFTAINLAVTEEKADVVKLLIERKVNINHTDRSGWNPIHDACGHRPNIEILKLLHDAGVSLSDPNTYGQTPLHLAGHAQRPDVVAWLLEFRGVIDIEKRNNEGETPLVKTAVAGDVECMQRLLNAGAELNAQCSSGWTALMAAVNLESPVAAVDFLLSQPGIDIFLASRKQGAALHMACDNLDLDVIIKLLEHGADINQKLPGFRPTPLMAACMPSDILESETRSEFLDKIDQVVRALVDRGADVHVVCDSPISTPLCAAAQYAGPSTINYLVSEGLSLKRPGRLDRLPIHYAAINGRENFETVFQSDRDLLIVDKAGKNALHWAAQFGHVQTVEIIMSHAPSPEERRVRLNQADIDGWTALCWALRPHTSTREGMFSEPQDQTRTIQVLLENGANPDISVRMGAEDESFTVIELAQLHGASEEIINMLNEAVEAKTPIDDDTPRSIRAYKESGYDCDVCANQIWGPCWQCETCPDFDVCKKCFGQIDTYHSHLEKEDGEPHIFKLIVEAEPEVRDGPPSPDFVRKGLDGPRGEGEGDTPADDTMDSIMDFEVDDIPEEGEGEENSGG